jgi:putative hydrolase of the HAD superfamily
MMAARIDMVGFDADDTLWRSEDHYQAAQDAFEVILARYIDTGSAAVRAALLETERANLRLFGYGAKGMTLSMIEAAVAATEGRISAADIHAIVELGKAVLTHPVELLPGITAAVQEVARHHRIAIITKGDLFHQEAKLAQSGMTPLFERVEVVSEKDPATYRRLFAEFGVAPEHFCMVGNSAKSDVAPILALGGYGVHMPYHVTYALELAEIDPAHPRFAKVASPAEIPAAVARFRG